MDCYREMRQIVIRNRRLTKLIGYNIRIGVIYIRLIAQHLVSTRTGARRGAQRVTAHGHEQAVATWRCSRRRRRRRRSPIDGHVAQVAAIDRISIITINRQQAVVRLLEVPLPAVPLAICMLAARMQRVQLAVSRYG